MRGDENRHSRGLSAWHTRFACVPVIIGMVLTASPGLGRGKICGVSDWAHPLALPPGTPAARVDQVSEVWLCGSVRGF